MKPLTFDTVESILPPAVADAPEKMKILERYDYHHGPGHLVAFAYTTINGEKVHYHIGRYRRDYKKRFVLVTEGVGVFSGAVLCDMAAIFAAWGKRYG